VTPSSPVAPSPRAHLDALYDKLEAFFTAARVRHGEALTCRAGCSDCCARRFTVTALEATVIREGLRALAAERRSELARRANDDEATACPALDLDGRCAIYASRPAICRTHGLPIRFAGAGEDEGEREVRRLPVVDACPRNFVGQDLAGLDPASVLDQEKLSMVLGALDAAHAAAEGRARGERVSITALLLGG